MAGFTNNDRGVRRFALRKVADNLDLAASLGAETFVCWGGREGPSRGRPRTDGPPRTGTRRPSTSMGRMCWSGAMGSGSRWSPSPTSLAGDILLPTVGHALAFITTLEHPELVGLNPRSGMRRWPA